jgi:hypothetical protein
MSILVVLSFAQGRAAAREPEPPPGAASPTPQGSVFVDPLGLLEFGPRLGIEGGAGRFAGALYGRWFDGGLASRHMFLNDGDAFAFSFGVGARGRYYWADGLAGAHAGVSLEYLRSRIQNDSERIVTTSAYVVPAAEGGYRFGLRSFYADASAALGYAFKVLGNVADLPGGDMASASVVENKSAFYGAVSLDLGVYF